MIAGMDRKMRDVATALTLTGALASFSTGCMTAQHSRALVKPEEGCPIALDEVEDSHPINSGTAVADLSSRLTAKQPVAESCRDFNGVVAQNNEAVGRSLHASIAVKTAPIDKVVDYIDHGTSAFARVATGKAALEIARKYEPDEINVTASGGAGGNATSSSSSASSSTSSSNSKASSGGGHDRPPRPEPEDPR